MKSYVVALVAWFSVVNAGRTQPWTHIPENMTQFCVGNDICRRKTTDNSDLLISEFSHQPVPAVSFENCCTDCSCDEDCGGRDICCFSEMNSYKDRSHQECLSTSSPYENPNTPSVLMVTSLKDANTVIDTDRIKESTSDKPCGDVIVAPWGSMLPVYSKESRLVYKNHVCAREDNASDLVTWKPNFYCSNKQSQSYTGRTNQIAQLAYESFEQIQPNCNLRFQPPEDIIPDIKNKICYSNVIRSCNNDSNGHILFNMSAEHVEILCGSGLYSPFIFEKVYANVFCFTCNLIAPDLTPFLTMGKIPCKNPPVTFTEGGSKSMTLILNTDVLLNDDDNTHKHKKEVLACSSATSATLTGCKVVLCPTGKVRTHNGTCVFSYSMLTFTKPRIVLVLQPRESLRMSDIESSSPVSQWLKSPWPNVWEIGAIFSNETNSELTHNITVAEIVVYMYRAGSSVLPAMIESEMVKTLPKTFQICNNLSKCVVCDQRLSKFDLIPALENEHMVPKWTTRQEDLMTFPTYFQPEIKTYNYVFSNSAILYPGEYSFQTFTKTFLCNQIELKETEYDLYEMADLVLYKAANRTLFQHEFEVVREVDGVNKVRICLEDSDLVIVTNGCNNRVLRNTLHLSLSFAVFLAIMFAL